MESVIRLGSSWMKWRYINECSFIFLLPEQKKNETKRKFADSRSETNQVDGGLMSLRSFGGDLLFVCGFLLMKNAVFLE